MARKRKGDEKLEDFLRTYAGLKVKPRPKEIKKKKRQMRSFGYWKDRENVKTELLRVAEKLGHFPSWMDLNKLKEYALVQGIRNYHGGTLIPFRDEMGYKAKVEVKPTGYWKEFGNLRKELEGVVQELGHFPIHFELRQRSRSDILNALNYFGGLSSVRDRMGYEPLNQEELRMQRRICKLEERLEEPLEDYLKREYTENHRSTYSLGKEIGISQPTISRFLTYFGIPIRTASEARLPPGVKKPSKKELREMYVTQKMSSAEIATKIGASSHAVCKWLKDAGIEIRDPSERANPNMKKISREDLVRDYEEGYMSQVALAEKYCTSTTHIKNLLLDCGIRVRGLDEAFLPPDFIEPSKEELEREYVTNGRSAEEIGKDLGVSKGKVLDLLEKNNIQRRGRSSRTDSLRPEKNLLEELYINQRRSPAAIGGEIGVSAPTVKRWLGECGIPLRGRNEAKMKKGARIPSEEELKRWYVEEDKTTVEIGKMVGLADGTIGNLLRDCGIEVRDRRGVYDSKTERERTFNELLKRSGKTPETISSHDFFNYKREDGTSYSGLLGWYRRNYECAQGAARDYLLKELCGLAIGSSVHSKRAKRVSREELASWDDFKSAVDKMFEEHPELEGKFPSTNWLSSNQYNCIVLAIGTHGGTNKVREKLGQQILRRTKEYWLDFKNIRREIEGIIESHNGELNGRLPSQNWLTDNGYSYIANAITRYYGGMNAFRKTFQERTGQCSDSKRLTSLLEEYAGGRE